MKLFYITNDISIAEAAVASGVDRIFVDLEYIGKEERQKGLDTVKSKHSLDDIKKIRENVNTDILVRVNPIHRNSADEIDEAIKNGADYIMLPMFRRVKEVQTFLKLVNGRAKTILLFEHIDAINIVDEIIEQEGIDEAYIGLNDLHLSMGLSFMFELLTLDLLENVCKKFKNKSIPFGIGGIAALGEGLVPAEQILIELYRLGATATILSRGFIKAEQATIEGVFKKKIDDVRNFCAEIEKNINIKNRAFFLENKSTLHESIQQIVKLKKGEII